MHHTSLLILVTKCLGTTDSDFGSAAYSQFLHDNGITNDGLWQREFLSHIPYGISHSCCIIVKTFII